jgi:hypothetical protein
MYLSIYHNKQALQGQQRSLSLAISPGYLWASGLARIAGDGEGQIPLTVPIRQVEILLACSTSGHNAANAPDDLTALPRV